MITNLTKRKVPDLPWKEIKEKILGREYNLSLVLAGSKKMKDLNEKYLKKKTAAKTLSFSFSKNQGEIFLNIEEKLDKIFLLFIHSLLHLKGMEHGKNMGEKEEYWQNKLKLQ